MKVGILTLKIHSNFGFLMQLYALQQVLLKLGNTPYTYQIREEPMSFVNKIKQTILNIVLKYYYKENVNVFQVWPSRKEMDYIDSNTWDFVNKNINLTDHVKKIKDLRLSKFHNFDAYIVGSDQVWREAFSLDILSYYFSFLPQEARRMSYASSFGISNLDYSNKQIYECKQLISKFEYVTVREQDAVDICKREFNVNAYLVLDPTLLLDKADYCKLIEKESYPDEKYILSYILDSDPLKEKYLDEIASSLNAKVINILPPKYNRRNRMNLEKLKYPSIYKILAYFAHANYVVTDSFHGTVFSIIFERQFSLFKNPKRGNSRLLSLLRIFGLENRFATNAIDNIQSVIDYGNLSDLYEEMKNTSLDFLRKFCNERNCC